MSRNDGNSLTILNFNEIGNCCGSLLLLLLLPQLRLLLLLLRGILRMPEILLAP